MSDDMDQTKQGQSLDSITAWFKDRKDPLSTRIGVIVGISVAVGMTPAELVNWFLLLPKDQYLRLLSGVVLALIGIFLFRKVKK